MPAGRPPASPTGLVAAGHPAVASTAAGVLAAGGNAFDAAVAAGFASAAAEPCLSSLAGGGFLLARTADGVETAFDFFVDTPGRGLPPAERTVHFTPVVVRFPGADQVFHCGPGSVAVPGQLAGLVHVHRRLGRLPLPEVVAPAAALACDGVVLPPRQAAVLGLLEEILRRSPEAMEVFAPGGRFLQPGDTLRNEALGAFLQELADDPGHDLHRGAHADGLVSLMAGGAGLVTHEDLAAYRVVERPPLAFTYRGRRVLTNPAPALGGDLLALALSAVERDGPLPPVGAPGWAGRLVAAMVEVDRHRAGPGPGPVATRGTTHVSVADAEGNVAAMTSSNGECSGDVIPGTGILCNNMLGEDDLHPEGFHSAAPGTRVASMMAPTVVLGAEGRPELVLGSGGSKRIRTAILSVLTAVLDGGLDLAAAVEAPRLHWDLDHTEVEPGLAPETLAALGAIGPVNEWPDLDLYFGGVHAVSPATGTAAGDPRRDGASAAP